MSLLLHRLFLIQPLGKIQLHMLCHRHVLPFFSLFFGYFLPGLSLQHQHTFPLWRVGLIPVPGFLQRPLKNSLVLFRQLSAHCDFPVSQFMEEFFQRLHQPVRSLIEDQRPGVCLHLLQDRSPLLFLLGQKSFKGEPPGRQPRHGNGRNTSRRTRQRSHRDPGFPAHRHQLFSRI